MPMGPDPNSNTASAIGPATMARLEHGPLETQARQLAGAPLLQEARKLADSTDGH